MTPDNQPYVDCAIGTPPLNPEPTFLTKLRMLQTKLDGEDRCTVCEAIKALETPPKTDNSWHLLMFATILLFGSGYNTNFFDTMLKVYSKTMSKSKEESTDESPGMSADE